MANRKQKLKRKKDDRNKKFILGVGAIAGLVIALSLVFFQKNNEPPVSVMSRIPNDLLIKSHSPSRGPTDAKVTIVEFLDPECEACRAMHPIVKQIESECEGKLRVVTRYMPFHPNSLFVASAIEEARVDGKFEEALELLFNKQPIWGDHHNPKPELIPEYLGEIGIASNRLQKEEVIAKHRSKIDEDMEDGQKLLVRKTPTFFVNGSRLPEIGYEPLKLAVDQALAEVDK